MASIHNAKGKMYVVYHNPNPRPGEKKQPWEPFDNKAWATARQKQVEMCIALDKPIPSYEDFVVSISMEEADEMAGVRKPNEEGKITFSAFCPIFLKRYAKQKWGPSTLSGNLALLRNYINPLIGDTYIQDIDEAFADNLMEQLKHVKSVPGPNGRPPKHEYLQAGNISKIYSLLHSMFNRAVRWKKETNVFFNPFTDSAYDKPKYNKRDAWDSETVILAMQLCEDVRLLLAMNTAFACSAREGEILALEWHNVFISDEDIANGTARIRIMQTLERLNMEAINEVGMDEIYFMFPSLKANAKTRLVLKSTKTEESVREVFLPPTVAWMFRAWKEMQDEWKSIMGEAFKDYNLVFTLADGRPVEGRVLLKWFHQLREDNPDLLKRNVVFHSLRKSATQEKLKITGDLKAVQADGGWATADMVVKVYSEFQTKDQQNTARLFQKAFYNTTIWNESQYRHTGLQNFLKRVSALPAAIPEPAPALDTKALIEQLQQSPELAQTLLTALLQSQGESVSLPVSKVS